mgnify:CR=1 FL=1
MSNKKQTPDGKRSAPAPCSASLAERQKSPDKFNLPEWGTSITTGEIITMMLQREGLREDALATLAQTLADLGISGEEVAHWQKQPGICHDCSETDDRVSEEWCATANSFPTCPIEMCRGYTKADVQNVQDQITAPK